MLNIKEKLPICHDKRTCFAKREDDFQKGRMLCSCLSESYPKSGDCPFCKPVRGVTDGVFYPHREAKFK